MSIQQFIFAIFTVLIISVGQILFKLAAEDIDVSARGVLDSFLLNRQLLVALIVYGFATIAWLFVIRGVPLRVAYPIAALSFIIVPILSAIFLSESITSKTVIGSMVILLGVFISTSSS